MTEEHRLVRETERGRQAQAVFESPIFREAVDGLREQLLTEWRDTASRDAQGREQLWLAQNLLQKIEAHIVQTMTTGSMAKLQLQTRRTALERASNWMRGRWD